MAIQDLTTFTIVDSASDLTVVPSAATFDTMRRDADTYVYLDMGAGNIGDIAVDFSSEITNIDTTGNAAIITISNTIGGLSDIDTANDGISVYYFWDGSNVRIQMQDWGNSNTDTFEDIVGYVPNTFYFTLIRSGTTTKLEVYSNSSRYNRLGTLSITSVSGTYRYFYVLQSLNSAGTDTITGKVGEYDISFGLPWTNSISLDVTNTTSTAISAFPFYINLSSASGITDVDLTNNIFDELRSTGRKMKLEDESQNELYVEIETWQPSASRGGLWTMIDPLSASGRSLTLYYDHKQFDNTTYVDYTPTNVTWNSVPAIRNVWDKEYVGVWHLNQEPSFFTILTARTSGKNFGATSSSGVEGNTVNMASSAGVNWIDSPLGKALVFPGTFAKNQYVGLSKSALTQDMSPITIEATFKANSWGDENKGALVSKINSNIFGWMLRLDGTTGSNEQFNFFLGRNPTGGVWVSPSGSIALDTRYSIVVVYDDSNVSNDPIFYINGSLVTTIEETTPVGVIRGDVSSNMEFARTQNAAENYFDGEIDEVRISEFIRSADYVTLSYLSQTDELIIFDESSSSSSSSESFSSSSESFSSESLSSSSESLSSSSSSESLSSSSSSESSSSSSVSTSSSSESACTKGVHGLQKLRWDYPGSGTDDTYNKVLSNNVLCDIMDYVADAAFPFIDTPNLIFKQIKILSVADPIEYTGVWSASGSDYYANIRHYMNFQTPYSSAIWDINTKEVVKPLNIEFFSTKELRVWNTTNDDMIIVIAHQGNTI